MPVLTCLPTQVLLGFAVKRPPVTTADRRFHRIEREDRYMLSEPKFQTVVSFNRAETAQISSQRTSISASIRAVAGPRFFMSSMRVLISGSRYVHGG